MKSFETRIRVEYHHTDQMGIVHHSNYIRYFECGRTDMLKKLGLPIERIEEAGVMLPIVSVECRYRRPAKMGDRIRIVSMVDRVPSAKLIVRSEIFNQNDELLVEGYVTLGFIDSQTRRPVRCPENLVAVIEKLINQ